jgi:hypothetical protein
MGVTIEESGQILRIMQIFSDDASDAIPKAKGPTAKAASVRG